jgi:hypothetical protein
MSLEEALKANTAALVAMTAVLAKGGTAAATTGGKASDAAIAAAAGKAAATGGGKKPKPLTIEAVQNAFGEYLGTEDKALRKERIAEIKTIYAHFGGVAKAGELEEEHWKPALEALEAYKRGETPELGGDDDDGDGETSLV